MSIRTKSLRSLDVKAVDMIVMHAGPIWRRDPFTFYTSLFSISGAIAYLVSNILYFHSFIYLDSYMGGKYTSNYWQWGYGLIAGSCLILALGNMIISSLLIHASGNKSRAFLIALLVFILFEIAGNALALVSGFMNNGDLDSYVQHYLMDNSNLVNYSPSIVYHAMIAGNLLVLLTIIPRLVACGLRINQLNKEETNFNDFNETPV